MPKYTTVGGYPNPDPYNDERPATDEPDNPPGMAVLGRDFTYDDDTEYDVDGVYTAKEFCEDLKMRLRSFNTTVSSTNPTPDDYHDLYKTVMAYIDEVLAD